MTTTPSRSELDADLRLSRPDRCQEPRSIPRVVRRDEEQAQGAHGGPDRPGSGGLGQHLPGDHRAAPSGPAAPGDHHAGPARRSGAAGRRPETSRRHLVVARAGAGWSEHRRLQLPALRRGLPSARWHRGHGHVCAAHVRDHPRRLLPQREDQTRPRPGLRDGHRGSGVARLQRHGVARHHRTPRRGRRSAVHGLGHHTDQAVGTAGGRRPARVHRVATHSGRSGPAAVLAVAGRPSRRSHPLQCHRVRPPHHPGRDPELHRMVPGHRTPAGCGGLLPRTGQPGRGDPAGLPRQGPDAVGPPDRRHGRRLPGRCARSAAPTRTELVGRRRREAFAYHA